MQPRTSAQPLSPQRILILAIAAALALTATKNATAQAFPASINLGSLNGANGFRLDGAGGDLSGNSVSAAGDINGDGFADLIVGAYGAPSLVGYGSSYVVFGKNTPFAATLALSGLNGVNGFRLDGTSTFELSGTSVSGAGDINGDGIADVIIGAPRADPNGIDSAGSSYVVFGKSTPFAATLALSGLNGSNGFRLDGTAAIDRSGNSVSDVGDINGDGIADLVIGAYAASLNGVGSGSSYVVFGKSTPFTATVALSSLNGVNGFRLDGTAARDVSGKSVSGAGDINGDGISDLIIGACRASNGGLSYSGSSYVVFGKNTPFAATLALSGVDGTNGFRLDGVASRDYSGCSVSAAGDINGDGISDLIVGANYADPNGSGSGSSYVVFGKSTPFTSTLALSSLNGTNGFRLDGAAGIDQAGTSVSAAGDINGDGFADLIIGAPSADPNGSNSGSSYVMFGKSTPFAATLALSGLNGTEGFRLDGAAPNDLAGGSVSAAGDINGDGIADLIVGARQASPNGSNSGSSFVVFGRDSRAFKNGFE